jgi:small GTP-binding protein
MIDNQEVKLKICLVGEGAVGKTSLIKRYVLDAFDGQYLTTIGTKISKKEVTLKIPSDEEKHDVTMLIWDIMGQKGFRELLQEAYFYGAQGIIAVCDITNKISLEDLEGWIDAAMRVTGKVPIMFLANKFDLKDDAQFSLDELKNFASKYDNSVVLTSSAKTGENVIKAFESLGSKILKE